MLKQYLQRFFANKFYPTIKRDWYKDKGYIGINNQERFTDFLLNQNKEGAKFYEQFKFVNVTRHFIQGNEDAIIDSVLLSPKNSVDNTKAGYGIYFIFFQGRGEYYESRFRDMAIQAYETGASIVGFNPKGFCSSTGETKRISDIVNDGIAVIDFLIKKYKLDPAKQTILQGNSLGGGVQEMVSQYYEKKYGYRFRQINGNSFKTLSAVIACSYGLPLFEYLIKPILTYAGWEIAPGKDFYSTGIYRMVLRRLNDRTILKQAEFFHNIDIENDNKNCPEEYIPINKWLYENSQLTYDDDKTDPHLPSLNHFYFIDRQDKKKYSVYKLINIYIKESSKYI